MAEENIEESSNNLEETTNDEAKPQKAEKPQLEIN